MNVRKNEVIINFSLRIPEQLYKSIVSISKYNKYSINQTIKELLEQRINQNKKQELWEGFSAISKDSQDIEYGLSAQYEILDKDE